MASRFLVPAAVLLICAWLTGCTERERMGYSAIPQNSPGSWELRPYGEMRN